MVRCVKGRGVSTTCRALCLSYSKHLCLAALKKRAATFLFIFFIGKGGYKDQCLSSTASHKLCSWHNVVSNVENVSDPVTHSTPNTCASPH